MADLERLAADAGDAIREFLERAFSSVGSGTEGGDQERARELRRDPSRVAGSTHFASVLAYGDFVMVDGPTIRCEAIPGLSGVMTETSVSKTESGQPTAALRRILTHFHFDEPEVAIEQHYGRESVGALVGAGVDGDGALLPGRASFSQYLILTLDGRPLTNPDPLVMTADRVEEWPPIGSTFVSEAPTDFVELEKLGDPEAETVARLMACKAVTVSDLGPVLPPDHQRATIK